MWARQRQRRKGPGGAAGQGPPGESPGPARPPQAGAIRGFRQRSSSRRRAGSGQGRGRRRVAASTSRGWSGAQVTCGGRARAADSQPWGLVLLKVTSMGKFHTSARLASRLLDVIWEMSSSRPCEDRDGDAGGPAPGVETCLPPAKEAEGRGAAARLSSLRATWPCARVPPRLRGVGWVWRGGEGAAWGEERSAVDGDGRWVSGVAEAAVFC